MNRILRNTALLVVLLTVLGTLFFGFKEGCSVLVGGGLSLVNLVWLTRSAEGLLSAPENAKVYASVGKYLLRLLLIFGTLFAMIHFSFLSLWGAVLGLSVLVLSTFVEAVILVFEEASRKR